MVYLLGTGRPLLGAFQSGGDVHLLSVLRPVVKRFIKQLVVFLVLVTGSLACSLFFVPSRAMSESILKMAPAKVAMVRDAPSPRIIFVGGSNLSMGLNSQVIAETFGLPVVNMGLHGGLGLFYMLEEVRPHVKADDIVVLVPEYEHFFGNLFYGNKEVLGVVFEIMPEKREYVSLTQWSHLVKYVPGYAARKLVNLVFGRATQKALQQTDSCVEFNAYGDYIGHWNRPSEMVVPSKELKATVQLCPEYFDILSAFVREARAKGAQVVIVPPCLQATSFDNMKPVIMKIENEFRKRDLPLIVPASLYRMDDAFCSGTPYHLNKPGVDRRTGLLTQNLSEVLRNVNRQDR